MKFTNESMRTLFAKNRTEELGSDVYKHFVVPPFFDKLDLDVSRKPRLIIGGRGCGKTMLLRYLSHQSAFSRNRDCIPGKALEHIGLYWRVDTQFASIMKERKIEESVWSCAFNHLIAVVLGMEILYSLKNISISVCESLQSDALDKARLNDLSIFDESLTGGVDAVLSALRKKLWEFELWVANVRKCAEPIFFPGVHFLNAVIATTKNEMASLSEALFFVYVDEFENLLPYQQRILNTCLKHSEAPLIFNIAMKRHAFETTATVGSESIQNIADYRKYDLEEYLLSDDFPVFAAEVLFLNLSFGGMDIAPVVASSLRDPDALSSRRCKSYQQAVLAEIRTLLPGLNHDDLARTVFTSESLSKKLRGRLTGALTARESKISVDSFYRPHFPQASITATALLHRKRVTPEEITIQMDRLERGEENKFTDQQGWIHNNFIGCLLWLYESHSNPCPLYSGFDTFCVMSRGNLRHFLELCHVSLKQIGDETPDTMSVSPSLQARAARQASTAFLSEIPAFGRQGDRLHTFVLRLGSLFALAHRRPTQSEPEQSHFAIASGTTLLGPDVADFLREAEKWSVLFEDEATKAKSDIKMSDFEYVLNPIYSPYFNITYRKKRKLDLSTEDLKILIHGTFDEANELLKRFSKKWQIEELPDANLFFRFFERNV